MRYIAAPKRKSKKRGCRAVSLPTAQDFWELKQRKFIKKQLIAEHGAVCAICGKEIRNMKELSIDHIVPQSKGGLTVKENCQLACQKCNSRKGDQLQW